MSSLGSEFLGEILISFDVSKQLEITRHLDYGSCWKLKQSVIFFDLQGAIVSSSGSLENNEHVGQMVMKCLRILTTSSALEGPLDRISFMYADHVYTMLKSGKNIRVVHKNIELLQDEEED